jgi:hypothetical protein
MGNATNQELTLKEWEERGNGLFFITERYTILRRWISSIEEYRYFVLAHLLTYPYLAMADGYWTWAFTSVNHIIEHFQHKPMPPTLEDVGQAIFGPEEK